MNKCLFPWALNTMPMLACGHPSAIYTSGGTAERKMLRTRSKCTISGIGFGSKYLANLKVSGQECGKESGSVTA